MFIQKSPSKFRNNEIIDVLYLIFWSIIAKKAKGK